MSFRSVGFRWILWLRAHGRLPQLVWQGELVVTSKKGTSPLFHLCAFTDSHDKSLYDSTLAALPSRLGWMARPPGSLPLPLLG